MTRGRHLLGIAALTFVVAVPPCARAQAPAGTRASERPPVTFFDHLENAWAVGDLRVLRALQYRGGQVLAYPGTIIELTYARKGSPRNVLIVHELPSQDAAQPFAADDEFFAAITILPKHAFWRDNLPPTPRHGILGGLRYAFRGEDAAAAKAIAKAYTATFTQKMPERTVNQLSVVVDALASNATVLREDAVEHLAHYPLLARDLNDAATERLGEFLKGTAPEKERIKLIASVGDGGVSRLVPVLESLTARDDAIAAAALAALAALDLPRTTERLLELGKASNVDVRAYAYGALAKRAKSDKTALEAATAVLSSDEPASVRSAAAAGLANTASERAIPSLRAAVFRGDDASAAAAAALAAIGKPDAVAALRAAATEAPDRGMVGAIVALVGIAEQCAECRADLVGWREDHPNKAVRDLIGVLLESEGADDRGGQGGDGTPPDGTVN